MSKLKGTDITTIRSLFQNLGGGKENELKNKLSPENYKVYKNTLSVSWVPVKAAAAIMAAAGQVLYPKHANGVWEMGRECAHDNLKDEGIYTVLFKDPSVRGIFSQGTKIWETFYDTGKPVMEMCDEENHKFVFCVKDDPELTPVNLDFVAGYIEGMFEIAGKKDIQIKIENKDPNARRWHVTWAD
jgi:hypothetical protein